MANLLLLAESLYTPGQKIAPGALLVEDDRIRAVGRPEDLAGLAPAAERLDLGAARLIPGLIDLHIHGAGGYEALGAPMADLCRLLPRYGITTFLPTTYPVNPATFLADLDASAAVIENPPAGGAVPAGLHLEGPFLSPRRPGMADKDLFAPLTWEAFTPLYEAARRKVSMLTFAPEEGAAGQGDALNCIPRLRDLGIIPALGHTDASFDLIRRAVALGLNHATHTFNAMKGLHHREPGTAGAVLYFPEITAQLVGDGQHVHPAVMAILVRAKGIERVCLVSDAQPFAGLPPGIYHWGRYELHIDEQISLLPDGTIASSVLLTNTMLRVLVEQVGLSFGEAVATAAETPARVLGLNKGQLAPGFFADVTALNEDYQPVMTMIGGRVVYWAE